MEIENAHNLVSEINNFNLDIPKEVFREFLDTWPRKPYCMHEKLGYMNIRPLNSAIHERYIQINPPSMKIYLIFDDDKEDAALSWFDAGLPKPFWTTQNTENGHCHHCYKLEIPVCTSTSGSLKAIKYVQVIYYAYALKMGADLNYSHLITKNPLHAEWRTTFWTNQAYTLDYLADFVDIPKQIPKKLESVGLGRNVTLFEKGRYWAYKAIRDYMHYNSSFEWEKAVRAKIEMVNSAFEEPLPYSEVKSTAKSIAKWVWQRFSYGEFRDIQAKRGAKGGKKGGAVRSAKYAELRAKAKELKEVGLNNTQISDQLGVSRRTIINWFRV